LAAGRRHVQRPPPPLPSLPRPYLAVVPNRHHKPAGLHVAAAVGLERDRASRLDRHDGRARGARSVGRELGAWSGSPRGFRGRRRLLLGLQQGAGKGGGRRRRKRRDRRGSENRGQQGRARRAARERKCRHLRGGSGVSGADRPPASARAMQGNGSRPAAAAAAAAAPPRGARDVAQPTRTVHGAGGIARRASKSAQASSCARLWLSPPHLPRRDAQVRVAG